MKRPELYFYPLFGIWLLISLGLKPESITLNLLFVDLNDIKFDEFELAVRVLTIVGGFTCFVFNLRYLPAEFRRSVERNSVLNDYVTKALQEITGSSSDAVSESKLQDFAKPKVDTGTWTSFKNAGEKVMIPVPFALAFLGPVDTNHSIHDE